MARIMLVTGGARSGKSVYAQRRAEHLGQKRIYIATCPVIDAEMQTRIDTHKQARAGHNWLTVEEETELGSAIEKSVRGDVILVDCLTLWINNLLYGSKISQKRISESDIEKRCQNILQVSRSHAGPVLFVTNEVGSGIVPDNEEARHYRDLVGRCNQTMAAGADEVVLVSCGIPLILKSENRR